MRIAFPVQRTYPSELTGSERYVHDIARGLAKSKQVEILATRPKYVPSAPAEVHGQGNLQVLTFPETSIGQARFVIRFALSRAHVYRAQAALSELGDGLLYSSLYGYVSRSLYVHLRSNPPDVIHCAAVPTGTAWMGWKAAIRTARPLVITPFLHLATPEMNLPFIRRMLRDATAVIAATEIERKFLLGFGVPWQRLHVIPPGIDFSLVLKGNGDAFRLKHDIPSDSFVILVPRKSEEKGTFDVLSGALALSRSIPELRVVMLGSTLPVIQSRVNAWARRLEKSNVKVLDLGFLPDTDYRDALAGCDVLAQPSIAESFGLVYLDSWMESKPVIAAVAGAVPEVVQQNIGGLLVEYGRVDQIANALKALFDDPGERKRMGQEGRELVHERYGLESKLALLDDLYGSLFPR